MHARATNAYRRVYVESAEPGQVLDHLYTALSADLRRAGEAIRAGDPASKGAAVSHALSIVSELNGALDHKSAPELCKNLASLYGFVTSRLMEASASMDAELLPPAEKVVETLADAFRQAGRRA